MPDFDDVHGSSVNARMAAHAGEKPVHVDDLEREPVGGEPPVPGAQWDELHRRWEHWDEAAGTWVVVGDPGDGVAPEEENPIPSLVARELLHADEVEADHLNDIPDVDRDAVPEVAPPGAQWNEVVGRWERWDETSASWVAAT